MAYYEADKGTVPLTILHAYQEQTEDEYKFG